MKKKIIEWIFFVILIISAYFKFLAIGESMIIYSLAIGLDYILEELQKIRVLLEKLNSPLHINCRSVINPYFENEEEDENENV